MEDRMQLEENIMQLFTLRPGEFDRIAHLPLAEYIVERLGKNKMMPSLRELVEHTSSHNLLSQTVVRMGTFLVDYSSVGASSYNWGLFPKIIITSWSDNWRSLGKEVRNVVISYKHKEVKVIGKQVTREKDIFRIDLPFQQSYCLSSISSEILWKYKV